MSQQEEQLNHNKRNKLFDRLFLIILCLVYSLAAFFRLGDDFAPQTFYRLEEKGSIVLLMDEVVRSPKILFYTGITDGEFMISLAKIPDCDVCASGNRIIEDKKLEYTKKTVDGSFRWTGNIIRGDSQALVLRNDSNRDIDLGEIGIYADNKKVDFKAFRYDDGVFDIDEEDIDKLSDEPDMVTGRDDDYMNSSYFDEYYFAQTAYQYATEQKGYENVHPPLGKLLQSIPIAITGRMTPFTWRCMGAFTGVIIIVAVYFLAKEIFGKASYARVAAIMTALSGLHFVQTRIGTVDSYLCLFTVLAFLFMVKFINSEGKLRYFALSGLFFGLSFSVKWSGAFGGIGLAILFFNFLFKKIWIKGRSVIKNIFSKNMFKWGLKGITFFILLPAVIYYSCYLLFPKSTHAYSISDATQQSINLFNYHKGETRPHPYSSKWFTWPISLKPMLYQYDLDEDTSIKLFENYAIAYPSVICLIITAFFAFRRKNRESFIIIIGWLALFIPYAFVPRTMFLYHYLPASVFAILSVVNLFSVIPKTRRAILFYLLVVLVVFIASFRQFVGI